MKSGIKIVIFLLVVLFTSLAFPAFSQTTNTTCANAAPFCTGQTMNFPAQTGNSQAQAGPSYSCLGSQPRPTWFFMQILNSGPMVITMSANFDIDFCAWGPFPNLGGACGNLTNGNVADCSYSGSNTETCTIANAVAGQFYLLLITNFNGATQNITFQQQNANQQGAATTNCGFVCSVTASNSGIICPGQSNTLSLSTSTAVTSYTWFGPNNYSTTSAFNVVPSLTTTTTFTLKGTANATVNAVPSTGTCQAVTTITVVPFPSYTISPGNPIICQGGNVNAVVVYTAFSGPGPFTYAWSPALGAGVASPTSSNTNISPPLLPTTVSLSTIIYTLTVSPTAASCPISRTIAITINNPLTPTLTMPPPQCNTNGLVTLLASPGGGTWSANPAVTSGGILNTALAAIGTSSVMYSVSVGTCIVSNKDTISVSRFNTAALTSSISLTCEKDPFFNLMNIVQSTLTGVWGGGPYCSNNIFNPGGLPSGTYSLSYNTVSTPIASVCPANTVITVQVFNPPIPLIAPIAPACNNSPTVALVANPPGGLWSQSSGVSFSGVKNPSVCSIGTNTVVYTAGIGTCVASSSATFHVSQFNTANITGTINNLCAKNNVLINLMGIVQNTVGGSWTGTNVAAGASASSYSFSPTGLPTNTYSLIYNTVSTPNALICPDSRTIVVSVLNPPSPNIASAGPLCTSDGTVQLSVTPANSGTWTAFPYVSGTGVFNPSLCAVGVNLVQYVTGTSTCSAQHTRTVNVEAFVPATITNKIADLCNTGSAVSLLPITLSSNGTWVGSGVLGSNFSPGVAGAGNHVLTYNTSSSPSGLCPDQATVSVKVFSLATPVISAAGPFCTNSLPFKLFVNPVGGIFSGANNGAVNAGGLFNPAFAVVGNNFVSYSISAGPCVAFGQSTVFVQPFISADFASSQPISFCQGDLPVNMNSYVLNPGGFWSGTGIVSGNMFNPAKANLGSNNQITYKTFSLPDALLCPDTKTVMVTVNETPTVVLSCSSGTACAPANISFDLKPVGGALGGKADWYIGDKLPFASGISITHSFSLPGSYTILANYVSEKGCVAQDTLTQKVLILASPKADFAFEPEELSVANPVVTLSNLSSVLQNNRYLWTVSGPAYNDTKPEVSPVMSFTNIGTYRVRLLATDFNGCKSEITRIIDVKNDFNVFIPAAFTPNADGVNDYFFPVFSPFGLDSKSFEMDIFDRWGHVIYHSKDPNKGWDGTILNKGESTMKQDVYIYKIKFKDLDGKIYDKIGEFTLITQ
ncbi:MAG: gliding motility-associated C-terminal domain-containing protein [Bacteroidia bacterium]|nr:gliding motility-associated C-terminal domain-containing protein [Bacteroidia bacterium]